MSAVATKFAIDVMRKWVGNERDYNSLFLGSFHDVIISPHTHIDWIQRGVDGNVNFMFDKINAGKWDLIVNCCCEHMYPMREITLPGLYVLQSNNRYGDKHINRKRTMKDFLVETGITEPHYTNTSRFDGADYFTVIGEKW